VKKAILAVLLLVFLVVAFWFIAVPDRLIISLIEDSLPGDGLSLGAEGFRKGFFYNFSIDRVSLVKKAGSDGNAGVSGSTLLALDGVSARIDPFSVLRLNPEVDFTCDLRGGGIEGKVSLLARGPVRMSGRNIPLGGLSFLESFGIRGEGSLSGELRLKYGRGEARVNVENVRLQNSSLGDFFLPLGLFHTIQGLITIQDKAIILQSFSFTGEGVHARARGELTGRDLKVNLEVTADSTFPSEPALHAMLARYAVSPGYYLIPVKTRLPQ
jgi:type II secretion system protein N